MYFNFCSSDFFFKQPKILFTVCVVQERGHALVLDFEGNKLIKTCTAIAIIQHNDKPEVYQSY